MVAERSKATWNLSTDCSQVWILLGTTISISKIQIWPATFQIVGSPGGSCAAYDMEPSDPILPYYLKIGTSSYFPYPTRKLPSNTEFQIRELPFHFWDWDGTGSGQSWMGENYTGWEVAGLECSGWETSQIFRKKSGSQETAFWNQPKLLPCHGLQGHPTWKEEPNLQSSQLICIKAPNQSLH